jgi:hypothetical protein
MSHPREIEAANILPTRSNPTRTYGIRHNWLTTVERQYIRTLLDEAIEHGKLRDMKACAAFVEKAIKTRRMSTGILRPDVIITFATKKGLGLVNQMLKRHEGYKNLLFPLLGQALQTQAAAIGLVQQTMTVRGTAQNENE